MGAFPAGLWLRLLSYRLVLLVGGRGFGSCAHSAGPLGGGENWPSHELCRSGESRPGRDWAGIGWRGCNSAVSGAAADTSGGGAAWGFFVARRQRPRARSLTSTPTRRSLLSFARRGPTARGSPAARTPAQVQPRTRRASAGETGEGGEGWGRGGGAQECLEPSGLFGGVAGRNFSRAEGAGETRTVFRRDKSG